jgi:hypothetical protein
MIQEEELREARLEGMPCRAAAWMDVTRIEVVRKGEARPVTGMRTWRGVAVVDAGAKIISNWVNRPVSYSGRVRVGEDEREVSANVFITGYRRSKPQRTSVPTDSENGSTYYIEFTGAGNLQG